MGQRAIRSWINRHSYHSVALTVKNKKLDHRVLANWGLIVFCVDPRSASSKGAISTWTAYRRLGVVECADLVTALEWLTTHPWVDGERIGMQGHSYGGFMTAYMMTHTRLLRAGVAGAPVTDWRLYDTIYTERYMDTPQRNPSGYDETSVLQAAAQPARPLAHCPWRPRQ